MIRLGIDLRHVPDDGSVGAGIEHASIELAETMEVLADRYGIVIVRVSSPKRALPLRQKLKEEKIDALFVPSGAVPPFVPVPFFSWVHDVEIFQHPEWFDQHPLRRGLTTSLFLRGVRNARHLFAVSEDTKRELMKIAGVNTKDVTVTYEGICPIKPGEQESYALILGSINPRKNVDFIVDLWPEIERRVPSARLVIAGRPVMRFDDEQRDTFIRHASVLLLPSLHEGFGRAALEAMSAGVPVIASDRGAIPEVVGDAGVLIDPNDHSAWIEAITSAFQGKIDGSRGRARAAEFSWEKTASTILAKIKECC
jgi:glycosyltransferase involved in cell wall biosynthesis